MNEKTGTIKVKPNDTDTARAFMTAMDNSSKQTKEVNHSFFRSKSEVVTVFLRLKEVIRLMNETSYDRKINVDLESSLTQEKLSKLHEFFEDMGERIRSNTMGDVDYLECWEIGQELNHLIHRLEGSTDGANWMTATFLPFQRISLTEKMYQEGTREFKKDYMYAGYAETGKNLYNAYYDKEDDLIKRKMVQPQRAICSEFFLPMEDMEFDYEDYANWCEQNDAKKYGYDYEHIKYHGKWQIGRVIESYLTINFPMYDEIRYRIEENA